MQTARTSPPPIPAAALRRDASGVRARPRPPEAKLPSAPPAARLPPKRARLAPPPALIPPKKPLARVEHPRFDEDRFDESEDTLVEQGLDAFDALLASEAPPPPPKENVYADRARNVAHLAADRIVGALECFSAHRDARVLSMLVAGATVRAILPLVLLAVAFAAYEPAAPLPKEASAKVRTVAVLVPMVIEAPRPAVEERADPPRERRAHRRRARRRR